jgi:Spy/CpxP family protein refolding chaperone
MRRTFVATGLALGLLFACEDKKAEKNLAPPPAASSAPMLKEPAGQAPATSAKPRPNKRGHRAGLATGGTRAVLRAALRELDLTEEQKTEVESWNERVSGKKVDEAERALRETLAAGAREGKLDEAAVKTKLEALKGAARGAQDEAVAVLNELHALLKPAQRKTLVASLAARSERSAYVDWIDPGPRRSASILGGLAAASWGLLTRGLKLSTSQRKKVSAAMRSTKVEREVLVDERKARAARTQRLSKAFAGDDFDAKKLATGVDDVAMMARLVEGRIAVVRTLLPDLDEKERNTLSDNLANLAKLSRGRMRPRR